MILSCPAGKKMVGGGGTCTSLGMVGWVMLVNNSPISDNEWQVSCDTPEHQMVMAEAFAVCL